MLLYRSGLLVCFLTILSCKTVTVQNKQYQITAQKVALGSVGIDKTFDLERTYTAHGIPDFIEQIKVQVTPIALDKRSFKAYNKAKELQPSSINVRLVDSLPDKPKFLNVEIADKVGLMNLLNDPSNTSVNAYLQNQKEAHIVTNISIVLNVADMNDLLMAEEVFITQIGIKTIGLKLFNKHKITRTINFNDGVVFAYRASKGCWKENNKYQLEIVELIEGDDSCPSQTYRSSKRAKKKIDYFKF